MFFMTSLLSYPACNTFHLLHSSYSSAHLQAKKLLWFILKKKREEGNLWSEEIEGEAREDVVNNNGIDPQKSQSSGIKLRALLQYDEWVSASSLFITYTPKFLVSDWDET